MSKMNRHRNKFLKSRQCCHYRFVINTWVRKFCAFTSLHGFIYFADEDKSIRKKLFWICVLFGVLTLCTLQTFSLVKYWDEGNILVTKESTSVKVWDIPFPAITLCGDNQINETEYLLTRKNLSDGYLADLEEFINNLCDTEWWTSSFNQDYKRYEIHENTLKYVFNKLVLQCEKIVLRVFWMNEELPNACQFFQPIILSTGVCYTLNMATYHHLFRQDYIQILEKILYNGKFENATSNNLTNSPWSVAGDSLFNSITMSLSLKNTHFKQYCEVIGHGLMIFIHHAWEYPSSSTNRLFINFDSSNLVLITAKSISTSNSLINWNSASRGCYYDNEKMLTYFKIYTQSNCELECHINKTIQRCGCVSFYHPRSRNVSVCGSAKRSCTKNAASTKFSIFGNKSAAEENSQNINCQCLPSCSELTYSVEMSETATNWTHIQKVNFNISSEFLNKAFVTFHFKKKSVDNWVRSPVIRFNELVANIGGIMSLCIGCSIISCFETIYFVAIRKWTDNGEGLDEKNKRKIITKIKKKNKRKSSFAFHRNRRITVLL